LFEKQGWGILGSIMFFVGVAVFAFTVFAAYLKKQFIEEPSWLLLLSMALLVLLIFAQVVFGRYILAVVIAALCTPIVFGWVKVKSSTPKKGNGKRKK